MRDGRHFKLNRKSRKEFINEVDYPKNNEERRPELAHEMRRVEQMQHLENTKPDQEIRRKNAGDVRTADLENFLSCHLHAKEECNGNE